MALSQRLEFRQTQALVMTPQLMQAIKLLQLSSLDLAAYVEAELEKNPLLERANDDDEAPVGAVEPEGSAIESGEGGEGGEEAAVASDWIGQDMETSRSSMEEGLGTELENVFPDDGAEKSAQPEMPPPAYSEWSGAGTRGSEDSA
jgi:RNA polymerase sigma-54 factor